MSGSSSLRARLSFLCTGIAIGIVLPSAPACREPCAPEALDSPAPAYVFESVLDDHWVLESGRVEVFDDRLVITYETDDGAQWEVTYLPVDPP